MTDVDINTGNSTAETTATALLEELGTEPDFEHRRLFASVRKQLLGKGEDLRIGRFRAAGRLGTGGMGEVYLCHDDELGRKVAVKRVLGVGRARDQERLREEARALARLSHPNVVQVYEVGVHEDRTFLAMEYVDGRTLADWLRERPPWRMVLDRFLAAGRGLAAAHRVGIVHRDFKPENVLIGKDGAVRVADFGVAIAEQSGHEAQIVQPWAQAVDPSMPRSVTGSVAGTIRYMPLEQIRGQDIDARTDQFAFCVALYEALWSEPPFPIGSPRERLAALEHGRAKPPSGRAGLWRVIRRGLNREPAARWQDMDRMLDALARVPVRQRRLAGTAFATAALGVGLGLFLVFDRPVDPCSTVERELDGVWDASLRESVGQHLAGLQGRHVVESRSNVLERLDEWSEDWVGEREQVCRANQALASAPDRLRLQDSCLTRQRAQVEQFVQLLEQVDADELADAVKIAIELQEPASCSDDHGLLGVEPPSPVIAPAVLALRAKLARAHQERLVGRFGQALAAAERIDADAVALGYGPLMAEARAERAKVEREAGSRTRSAEFYEEAIDLADLHRHDQLRAQLLLERAWLSLFDVVDVEDGDEWFHAAVVVHERVALNDARATARLHFTRGRVHELNGERESAENEFRSAIAAAQDSNDVELSTYQDALARMVGGEEALEWRRAALDAAIEHFGPNHPRTARRLYNYGVEARAQRKGGVPELQLAAAIWLELERQPPQALGKLLLLLGSEALSGGDLEAALVHARDLARLHDRILPVDDPDRGESEQLLATISGMRGDMEAALTHARVAASRFERSTAGRSDPRALSMRNEAGNRLCSLGRLDEATREFEQVLEHVGNNSTEALAATLGLAEVALRRGDLEGADQLLESSMSIADGGFNGAFLTALVALRRGRLSSQQVERLQEARSGSASALPETWFVELAVTAHERQALAL